MRRKVKAQVKNNNVCDNCRYAEWVDKYSNLDHDGKPICFRCKYRPGRAYIRGEAACDKYFRR